MVSLLLGPDDAEDVDNTIARAGMIAARAKIGPNGRAAFSPAFLTDLLARLDEKSMVNELTGAASVGASVRVRVPIPGQVPRVRLGQSVPVPSGRGLLCGNRRRQDHDGRRTGRARGPPWDLGHVPRPIGHTAG